MKFKLNFNRKCDEIESKFFGEIALPEKWIMKDIFSPYEFFLCQINLDDLPFDSGFESLSTGTLYFFVDAKKSPYKAVVRYYDGELDSITGFNDDLECEVDLLSDIAIEFCDDGEYGCAFEPEGDIVKLIEIFNFEGEELLPFGKKITFEISKDDLEKGDFSKVVLKIIE